MIDFPPPDPELAHLARRNLIITVDADAAGQRLDRFAAAAAGVSRVRARVLIDFGSVWVNGRVCRRQSRVLKESEYVTIQAPDYGPVKFYEADPARILYDDGLLLAYDKEAGVPSQQTPYDGYNHLFGALQRRRGGYAALHHRLDAPTSGVMLFAVDRRANPGLAGLFSRGPLQKTYLAVTAGSPPQGEWTVNRPIAKARGGYVCPEDGRGRSAVTGFSVLERGPDRTLLQARPQTGRTHQIRLHLAACGLPILGDSAYGGPPAPRLMLHARSLAFDHPLTGEPLVIEAPAPPGFENKEDNNVR